MWSISSRSGPLLSFFVYRSLGGLGRESSRPMYTCSNKATHWCIFLGKHLPDKKKNNWWLCSLTMKTWVQEELCLYSMKTHRNHGENAPQWSKLSAPNLLKNAPQWSKVTALFSFVLHPCLMAPRWKFPPSDPGGGGGGHLTLIWTGGAAGGRKSDPASNRSAHKKYTLSQYTLRKLS